MRDISEGIVANNDSLFKDLNSPIYTYNFVKESGLL